MSTDTDTYIYAYHTLDQSGPFTDSRRKIHLSQADHDRFWTDYKRERHTIGWVEVYDLDTSETLLLRWADCGLDCFCAAEWMKQEI